MKNKNLIILLSSILLASIAALIVCIILSNKEDFEFILNTKYVYINESEELKYTSNQDCKVEYFIEDESVAYIKGNVVYGVSVGISEIKIKVYVNKEIYDYTEKINVLEKESYYFIQQENITSQIGDKIDLSPTITSNKNSSNFTYASSNDNIVKVDENGIATVNQFGEAVISVFNHGRFVKSFNIKVELSHAISALLNCSYDDGKLIVESGKQVVFDISLSSGNMKINNFEISVKNKDLVFDITFNRVLFTTNENLVLEIECLPLNYYINLQIEVR